MNRLSQKYLISFLSLSSILLLFSCSDDDDGYSGPLNNIIESTNFTVNAPDGWKHIQGVGSDTQVGQIIGNKDTIQYDQGYMNFGSLTNVKENDQTISFQKLSIDGIPAIIKKDKLDGKPYNVVVAAFIDAGDKSHLNQLFAYDPKDEELIIRIFKSHKFK